MIVILDFCFYFISQKRFYCLLKGFTRDVACVNITKEVLFLAPNQAYAKITLFIICLSVNITFCVSKCICET